MTDALTTPNNHVDLKQLARILGGDVVAGQVIAPGPSHSPRDRSLAIRPSVTSQFGFIVHSHAGDDWHVCRDYVLEKLGLRRELGCERNRHQRRPHPDQSPEDYEQQQREKAAWLWSQRRPIAGTPAKRYLREARGYAGSIPQSLAFLPPRKPTQHPAMISAFGSVGEPEPGILEIPPSVDAVHLTLLRPDGGDRPTSSQIE